MRNQNAPKTLMNFDELNLAPAILKAVREQGYDTPTPIQQQAIPAVLAGADLLAGAQTGTGKTAAFTLPLLHRLSMSRSATNKFGGTGIRALVLTPTRELAAQVEESVRNYGQYLQLSSAVVFGGVGMNPQINQLKKGVDILVATPGRLLDLAGQGFLDLSTVQILVLDEADRMLDMGFIHDVKKVLALVPAQKQSLLFSATFSDEIRDLANGLLREPQHIQVTPRNTTVQRITQVIHPVGRGKKKDLLTHIIQTRNWSQVLVFTRTKHGANNVADHLTKNGIPSMALHGNKSQAARTQALAGFKTGQIRALVATDIAARGIDIDELPHVVNYEIPNVSEDYVHRIGRTGRAGNAGEAVNLVCLDEEGFMKDVERFTQQDIPVEVIDGFGPEEGETAQPIAMGRQTIWGGLGKPPSREVMAQAARAARQEMMQRIQEKRSQGGDKNRRGQGGGHMGHRHATTAGQNTTGHTPHQHEPHAGGGQGDPRPNARPKHFRNGQRPFGADAARGDGRYDNRSDNRAPRDPNAPPKNIRHEGRFEQAAGQRSLGARGDRQAARQGGQPNPLSTNVDALGKSANRSGGGGWGNKPRRPGGGGAGGGAKLNPNFIR